VKNESLPITMYLQNWNTKGSKWWIQ